MHVCLPNAVSYNIRAALASLTPRAEAATRPYDFVLEQMFARMASRGVRDQQSWLADAPG